MMNENIRLLKLICLIYVSALCLLNSTEEVFAETPEGPFKFSVGEKLTFSVRWMGIPVGYAVLHIKEITQVNGRPVYHIICTSGTNSFFSKFYRVEDKIETFVDVEGLYPWRFEKHLREGHYTCNEFMEYDQLGHQAVYGRKDKDEIKKMEIPPEVQDALSCIYYFRTRPLKVGDPVYINVNADEKNWKMEVDILSQENKEIRNRGVVPAFKVEPRAEFKGMFVRRGRLWAWVTADSQRLPVLVETRVPRVGVVVAVLEEVENTLLADEGQAQLQPEEKKQDEEQKKEDEKKEDRRRRKRGRGI